jgi:hypothetical protein
MDTEVAEPPFNFHIYPNPNNGIFTIEGAQLTSVMVYDLLGGVVAQAQSGTEASALKFDLSVQPKGIYIVKAKSGDDMKVKRVVYH